MTEDLRKLLQKDFRLHPRVAQQELFPLDQLPKLVDGWADTLPPLPAFRETFHSCFAVLDWDHRLPSDILTLRIFGYYSEQSDERGRRSLGFRQDEIKRGNIYPEFDVPDFADIDADEAYDCELTVGGELGKCRLTSPWRREISDQDNYIAIGAVKQSEEFRKLSAQGRPAHLGGLESVAWTPPCESSQPKWTIDVWFLMAFDGRVGTGRSFLVDPAARSVLVVRDFSVRAG